MCMYKLFVTRATFRCTLKSLLTTYMYIKYIFIIIAAMSISRVSSFGLAPGPQNVKTGPGSLL
jgi:hypothetical protein